MRETSLTNFDWNTLAELSERDSFCYNQTWIGLIKKLYGYTIFPLVTTNSTGQVTGFLPLFSVRSLFTGRHLVALPFSDYCPLLAADETSANTLIDLATDLARRQKVRYLELRAGKNEILAKREDLVAVEDMYVRWLLPLATDTGAMWSKLRTPIQHQIKKSQKLGVKIYIAQHREDMFHYYRLHLQTRSKKHGMPAQSQQFFLELWDRFATQGMLQLLLAEYEGNFIAGMIVFASGTTIRYAYGASNADYLHLSPNNLLMWTAITWGCNHGYQMLDMGRTACDNEGLMEFKRRWGTIKEPLPYYYYPRQRGLATTSEHSWKYRLLTAGWKRLPLWIAELLSKYLYRYLG